MQEAKCAYVIFVMAALWITEALPMAVTSLLPVVLFPMMGVMPADKVSATYFSVSCLTWPAILRDLNNVYIMI